MIITTNFILEQIETIDERIYILKKQGGDPKDDEFVFMHRKVLRVVGTLR